MNPTALQIGPFSIKWYSLMILLGVIAGIGLLLKEGKKYNYPKDFLLDLLEPESIMFYSILIFIKMILLVSLKYGKVALLFMAA